MYNGNTNYQQIALFLYVSNDTQQLCFRTHLTVYEDILPCTYERCNEFNCHSSCNDPRDCGTKNMLYGLFSLGGSAPARFSHQPRRRASILLFPTTPHFFPSLLPLLCFTSFQGFRDEKLGTWRTITSNYIFSGLNANSPPCSCNSHATPIKGRL